MSLSNIKKVQFDFRIIYANLSAQNKIPEHNRIKLPATCCSQRFYCSIETIVAYTYSIPLSPIISTHCGPCCATGLVSSASAYLNMNTGFHGSWAADEPTNLITSSSTAGSAPKSSPCLILVAGSIQIPLCACSSPANRKQITFMPCRMYIRHGRDLLSSRVLRHSAD